MKNPIAMSTLLVSTLLLGACSAGSYGDRIADSRRTQAKLTERSFDLAPFSQIAIEVTSTINIRRGDEQKISVRTQDDHFANLDIISASDRLTIEHEGSHRGRRHIMIDIVTPNLDRVYTAGVIEAEITNIKSDDFRLRHDGMGDIQLSGECVKGDFEISGLGDLEAYKLRCEHVSIDMSGFGDAEVFASESVRIYGSGFGDIDIYGMPRVDHLSADGFVDVDFHAEEPDKDE